MDDLDDLYLIHRLETMFIGGFDWQTSQLQLNTPQVLDLVDNKYPKLFTLDNLPRLFEQMHIKPQFNEHNGKYYWLLNYVT